MKIHRNKLYAYEIWYVLALEKGREYRFPTMRQALDYLPETQRQGTKIYKIKKEQTLIFQNGKAYLPQNMV